MIEQNLTEQLIEALLVMQEANYPQTVLREAKCCLLDYLGCCLAGAEIRKKAVQDYLSMFRSEGGAVRVFGLDMTASAQNATLLNAVNAHTLELDDGHRFGMLHPGVPVISALLTIAQTQEITWGDFLRGVVAGYEVTVRLAAAIQPQHKLRGYHATGTCGTVGTAMGVAVAMHYTKTQMRSALATAATSAAGLLEVIDGDSELKPYNVGRAAMEGLTAAMYGSMGIRGPNDVLGGKRGFLSVLSPSADTTWLERENLNDYAIMGIYRKPYASCRHCHPPVEATLKILKCDEFKVGDVEEILVETYGLGVYGHDQTEIGSVAAAKMSTPYSVAAALVTGSGGMDAMSEAYVRDERILALARKVKVVEDKELSSLVPRKRAAVVTIVMAGTTYSERVDYPRGEPENPMTSQDMLEKFLSLAKAGGKTDTECKEIIDCVFDLENKLATLLQLL